MVEAGTRLRRNIADVARVDRDNSLELTNTEPPAHLQGHRRGMVGATVFFLVLAAGAITSQLMHSPLVTGSRHPIVATDATSVPDDKQLALENYTRSLYTPADPHATQTPPAGQTLPDVDTLVERLAARLQAAPQDVKGWRLLGWSYFHTGRFDEAVAAYARALELEPNSGELRDSYNESKSRASSVADREAGAGPPAHPDKSTN